MYVRLDQDEVAMAEWIAYERNRRNRELGIEDKRIFNGNIDLTGIAGELAFCKVFNIYPPIDTTPKKGGVDCILRGYRVDVKTSTRRKGDMIISCTKKPGEVDIFALVAGTIPQFQIVGYMLEAEALQPHFRQVIRERECYVIPQQRLQQFKPIQK